MPCARPPGLQTRTCFPAAKATPGPSDALSTPSRGFLANLTAPRGLEFDINAAVSAGYVCQTPWFKAWLVCTSVQRETGRLFCHRLIVGMTERLLSPHVGPAGLLESRLAHSVSWHCRQ